MVQQSETLYSFSGVVHGLSRSITYSTTQTVNNAVKKLVKRVLALSPQLWHFGLGPGTNMNSARSTSLTQSFDRGHNPNADTYSQVPTTDVLHYTAYAPRSTKGYHADS